MEALDAQQAARTDALLAAAVRRAAPFAAAALVAIVLGGLAAAVSRPLDWARGPWTAAFLVLVTGVGQLALGGAGALVGGDRSTRRTLLELAVWNGASLLVIGGVASSRPALSTIGSVAIAAGTLSSASALRARRTDSPAWLRWAAATVLAVVIVSIPIGIALVWMRA